MMSLRDYNQLLDQMDDERLPHDPDEFRDYERERPLGNRELSLEKHGMASDWPKDTKQ